MIQRTVVIEKFQKIDHCLGRIETHIKGNLDSLVSEDAQDIFVLSVQRIAQLAIDVAAHIIKDNGFELPKTLREYFLVLSNHDVVPIELAEKLGKMVGFRNIAVHNYQDLNVEVLKKIYTHSLEDIREFKRIILAQADD